MRAIQKPDAFISNFIGVTAPREDRGKGAGEKTVDPMQAVTDFVSKAMEEGNAAAAKVPRDQKPPDLRMKETSPLGGIGMVFTSPMDFPPDIYN